MAGSNAPSEKKNGTLQILCHLLGPFELGTLESTILYIRPWTPGYSKANYKFEMKCMLPENSFFSNILPFSGYLYMRYQQNITFSKGKKFGGEPRWKFHPIKISATISAAPMAVPERQFCMSLRKPQREVWKGFTLAVKEAIKE